MRGRWFIVLGVVALAGALAGAWFWTKRMTAAPPKAAPAKAAALPPGAEVRIRGTIRAVNVVKVPAPVDGVAEQFAVQPGDEVAEGQILGRISNEALQQNEKESASEMEREQNRMSTIESSLLAARLEEARAESDSSRARAESQRVEKVYQRQQLLIREGATARQTFERAERDYSAAKGETDTLEAVTAAARQKIDKLNSDLEAIKKTVAEKEEAHEQAKADLASANILAPVGGIVLRIRRSAGEQVEKGLPDLVEIAVDLTDLEVELEPDPTVFPRLKEGLDVLVLMEDLTAGLPGKVTSVADGKAIVAFASPSPLIRPGMTATVAIKLP
jgi:multidrug efflux pump subunit AcrA (membrane-fusion protein)